MRIRDRIFRGRLGGLSARCAMDGTLFGAYARLPLVRSTSTASRFTKKLPLRNPHPDDNDDPILSGLAQCYRLPSPNAPAKRNFD